MSKLRFVGLDVQAETIAVAIAETGGEVRSLGVIPNRLESIRKLIQKLGPVQHLRACYEAGSTRMDARTVLDVKGSLRRAKHRRAPDASAPFRPDRDRDGRLRREHSTARAKNKGRRSSRWLERLPKQNTVNPGGLDRVAPYQK